MTKLFLLSPARCDGRRAHALLHPDASFPLALQLRSRGGAPIGDVFAFLSGLYFRGKLTYARRFASRDRTDPATATGAEGATDAAGTADTADAAVRVITTNLGLVSPARPVRPIELERFAGVDLASAGAAFERPLRRDAEALAAAAPRDAVVVLLGSIATNKYVAPLLRVFGERLVFPREFVGRGDMSRGGLLLRAAAAGDELAYTPVLLAVRHGKRPPKLEPLK